MPAIRWQYMHWRRNQSLNTVIGAHLVHKPNVSTIEAIATHHGVTYAAVRMAGGAIDAWICPLDLSGEYGRFSVGFAMLPEVELANDVPDHWCRAPAEVLVILDKPSTADPTAWRARCHTYLRARRELGPLTKGAILRLAKPVAIGPRRAFWLQCLDGRAGRFRAIDLPDQPHANLSREAIIAHEGRAVTQADIDRHREFLYLLECAA